MDVWLNFEGGSEDIELAHRNDSLLKICLSSLLLKKDRIVLFLGDIHSCIQTASCSNTKQSDECEIYYIRVHINPHIYIYI